MTEPLKKHLLRCEKAMQATKPILAVHAVSTDPRTLIVVAFISALFELQESILLLLNDGMAGSASALSRPVVEFACRALWVSVPATDAELKRFIEKDEIPGFAKIVGSLDGAFGSGDLFQGFKKLTWKHLNSYTHGGMHQIGRRITGFNFANHYSDAEVCEIATTVTTLVLIVISVFLQTKGHLDSVAQIQALMESDGLLMDRTKYGDVKRST